MPCESAANVQRSAYAIDHNVYIWNPRVSTPQRDFEAEPEAEGGPNTALVGGHDDSQAVRFSGLAGRCDQRKSA